MKCNECGDEASYFHSKCCNAHMEGVIMKNQFFVVCEKCGKMVGRLAPVKKQSMRVPCCPKCGESKEVIDISSVGTTGYFECEFCDIKFINEIV